MYIATSGGSAVRAEPAGVGLVDDGAAGEDHHACSSRERDRQLLPVHEVAAHRVAPATCCPSSSPYGVVLVEEVVLAVEVDQAVGVVHPVLRRRVVGHRTVGVVVPFRRLRGRVGRYAGVVVRNVGATGASRGCQHEQDEQRESRESWCVVRACVPPPSGPTSSGGDPEIGPARELSVPGPAGRGVRSGPATASIAGMYP